MANVVPFAGRVERFRGDESERICSLVRVFAEAHPEVRVEAGKLVELVERHTASRERWRFVMIDPDRYDEVVDYLAAHSARPMVAVRLWTKMFRRMSEPGEVLTSRAELAAELGVPAGEVSRIVSALVKVGAMRTERKGGGVRYFVSPLIGTHLSGKVRDEAQRAWKLPVASADVAVGPVEIRRRAAPVRPAFAF